MRWIIMVLLMVLAFMMVICYSLLVMASRADEREKQMYMEWKGAEDTENSSEKPNNSNERSSE